MTKGKYYNPIPFPTSQPQIGTKPQELETLSNIPGSTIKCSSSKPRIEPINTPPEILQKLRQELASNRLSPSAKLNKIRRITGFCSVCGGVPEFFMIYDCDGVSKIERYCSPCLEKEKVRKY